MKSGLLQAHIEKKGLVFDPRTKLFFMMTMTIFVLGGIGGSGMALLSPFLSMIPFLLLFLSGQRSKSIGLIFLYGGVYVLFAKIGPSLSGLPNYLLLACAGIFTRFMPSLVTGMYLVSTTTVSEFTAALLRMHVSEKLIIPLSVIFRFFPSIADEFNSINAAMKMRGIGLGGNNMGKMLEYRLIPLMTCSAKLGEELSAAALTRGLGGEVKRTNVCKIGFHIQDICLFTICMFVYVLYVLTTFEIL